MTAKRVLGWTASIKVTDTTLWLPVTAKRPLNEVAREEARRVLGPDAPPSQFKMMERVIHDGTADAQRRGSMRSGLLFWPDFTRFPPVAEINLAGFYPPNPDEALTLEHDHEIYAKSTENTIGPISTTELELPLGPALRFHRHWARKKRLGTSLIHEDVIFAVRPAQIPDSLVFMLSWVEPQFSETLIKVADKMAETLEIQFTDEA